MKIDIVYSSLSGCTKKVAEAIYDGIENHSKSIYNLKDGMPKITGDIVLIGYWGANAYPPKEMQEFIKTIKNKAVGVFATLGYYSDTQHAFDTVRYAAEKLKDDNEIIGTYVCTGAISKDLKGEEDYHNPTEQKHVRWLITDSHPTKAECSLASERFNERIYLYELCKDKQIKFTSIM